jgi:hypothetical protein
MVNVRVLNGARSNANAMDAVAREKIFLAYNI